MTLYEFISPAILATLGVAIGLCQLPFFFKGKEKSRAWTTAGISVVLIFFSILDGSSDRDLKKENADKIKAMSDTIRSVQDTLRTARDTLVTIGLGIDNKTGRILIMDSLLLKKEFVQVFNITQTSYKNTEELSDSENVVAITRNDSVFFYPKKGTWAHAYYAHDTANSNRFIADFTEGMGTGLVEKMFVGSKTYNTFVWKIPERAIYSLAPMRLRTAGYRNRYIIFGDEGVPSKRWIYQNGKVTWAPW